MWLLLLLLLVLEKMEGTTQVEEGTSQVLSSMNACYNLVAGANATRRTHLPVPSHFNMQRQWRSHSAVECRG